MTKILKYRLKPEIALDPSAFEAFFTKKFGEGSHWKLLKRSIDARSKRIQVDVEIGLSESGEDPRPLAYRKPENQVSNGPQVIIVGAGPAGLFAAMRCIELGAKPIVLERGKDVRARRRNYCFGEGGAGTYSDGKLYTRSKKRGDVKRILEILLAHGSPEDIMVDTHPHIGTNKLPKVIADIRETILSRGGEIHFEQRVEDIILENK